MDQTQVQQPPQIPPTQPAIATPMLPSSHVYYSRTKDGLFAMLPNGQDQLLSLKTKFIALTSAGSLISACSEQLQLDERIIGTYNGIVRFTFAFNILAITTKTEIHFLTFEYPTPHHLITLAAPKAIPYILQNAIYVKHETTIDHYSFERVGDQKALKFCSSLDCPLGADVSFSPPTSVPRMSTVNLNKHFAEKQLCTCTVLQLANNQADSFQIEPANEVKQLWSEDGETLLVWAQLLEDLTNQSYFGTHNLYHYDIKKKTAKKVNLFDGPIHDVKWLRETFLVISGFSPAGAVLYDSQGVQLYLVMQAHINQIHPLYDISKVSYSKKQLKRNIVAICGFGNLAGDIYIFDLELSCMKKIGQAKQDKVVHFEWYPDGSHFLTATTFPRLRVDNQVHIYTSSGQLLFQRSYQELYEACWSVDEGSTVVIPQNFQNQLKAKKEIDLNSGHDFLRELKGESLILEPLRLSPDAKLINKVQVQLKQQQEATQQLQLQQPQQQAPKAKPLLMRRQEPMEPVAVVEPVQEPVRPQKGGKKQANNNKNRNQWQTLPEGLKPPKAQEEWSEYKGEPEGGNGSTVTFVKKGRGEKQAENRAADRILNQEFNDLLSQLYYQ